MEDCLDLFDRKTSAAHRLIRQKDFETVTGALLHPQRETDFGGKFVWEIFYIGDYG